MQTLNRYNAIRLACAAAVLIGCLASGPALRAQEPDDVQVVQIDETRFPEVDVYVSVTDAAGQPIKNLMPEDFELSEDGRAARLIRVSRAGEQGPVTTVLVIDKSGSMEVAGKMTAAQQAAGIQQISEAMTNVAQGGKDTADGARQLDEAVAALNEVGKGIDTFING
jgi:hypothetical protein